MGGRYVSAYVCVKATCNNVAEGQTVSVESRADIKYYVHKKMNIAQKAYMKARGWFVIVSKQQRRIFFMKKKRNEEVEVIKTS